ncbi:MAG: hypothetical protein GY773_13600, partial [Actinomycetia bacterium]|nr:hypothetical protein [Actinomycetes bacterium]
GPNPPSSTSAPTSPQSAAQAQPTTLSPQGGAPVQGGAPIRGGAPIQGATPQAVDQAHLHTVQISPDTDPLVTRQFEPQNASPQDQATSLFSPDNTTGFPNASPAADPSLSAPSALGAALQEAAPGRPPPTSGVGFTPPRQPSDQPSLQQAKKKGGLGKALLIIVSMVAAVSLGGFAYFYFTSDSVTEGAATGGESSLSADATEGDAAEASGDGAPEQGDPSETTTSSTSAEDPASDGATETSSADPDASTPPSTTNDQSTTSTTAGIASRVDDFRAILEENDLTSESLSDDEIQSFATNFCRLAGNASDPDDFDDIRETAIAATKSALSPDQLTLVINTAVFTFCPNEAER